MGKKKEKNDVWNIDRSDFLDDAINSAKEGLDLAEDDDQEEFSNRIKTILACFDVRLSDVIAHGIRVKNASARGGRRPKKPKGFVLACKYALKESPKKDCLSLWRFLIKCYLNEVLDISIEYDEDANKFYENHADGRSRPISFRTFQKYISELRNNRSK